MPETANKGFEIQVTSSNVGTWGSVLNTSVIGLMDTFLGGITSKSLSASNVALSQSDCQNGLLRMSGTLLANVVLSPDTGVLLTGFMFFENLTTGSFTVTFSNSAGSLVLPQTRRGLMWVDTTNGPRIMSIVGVASADPIPVGTSMLFYQTAAPSGWTISTSLNNYGLRIVSSNGGVSSGSIAYSTLFSRTATDSHTLVIDEMPYHSHQLPQAAYIQSGPYTQFAFTGTSGTYGQYTGAIGGSGGHTHNIDMRVQTADIIICTKN